jgi:DNA polymerase-3 subunit beta
MQINLKALKTVALFVSNEETRYYLMGVNVEARNDGFVFTATNGHYLTMARHDYLDGENEPDWGPFIIPIGLIDRIKLGRHSDIALIELGSDGLSISINYMGVTYTENRVEGTFPDARRVIPASVSGEAAQFNPSYVALFGKAKALITGKKAENAICICHNGGSPALVDFVPEDAAFQGFGVLMPFRYANPMKAPPAWAKVVGSSVAEAA